MTAPTCKLHEDLVRLAVGMVKVLGLDNHKRETHEALIRLAKGMIIAYEKWLQEH